MRWSQIWHPSLHRFAGRYCSCSMAPLAHADLILLEEILLLFQGNTMHMLSAAFMSSLCCLPKRLHGLAPVCRSSFTFNCTSSGVCKICLKNDHSRMRCTPSFTLCASDEAKGTSGGLAQMKMLQKAHVLFSKCCFGNVL